MDGTERHPPPIHLQLTQEARFPQSIQLSAPRKIQETMTSTTAGPRDRFSSQTSCGVTRGSVLSSAEKGESRSTQFIPKTDGLNHGSNEPGPTSRDSNAPRMSFAIRLKDTFRPSELAEDLFKEWLRMVPALIEEVTVEASFGSFSSLLIISVPISLSIYIPRDPAVISLGPITTCNLISSPSFERNPKLKIGEENRTQVRGGATPRLLLGTNVTLEENFPLLDRENSVRFFEGMPATRAPA
jgi:hypothetical protein